MELRKVDKRNLIEALPDYPKVFVDKKTLKIYVDRGKGPAEVNFYKAGSGYFVRSIAQLGLYVRRSRAIALALIKKPEKGLTRIVHKDGNPGNDSLDNLEWATRRLTTEERRAHARRMMHEKYKEKIFLTFADGCQYWCDRSKVQHLLDLRPRARGNWKEEYYTPWHHKKED